MPRFYWCDPFQSQRIVKSLPHSLLVHILYGNRLTATPGGSWIFPTNRTMVSWIRLRLVLFLRLLFFTGALIAVAVICAADVAKSIRKRLHTASSLTPCFMGRFPMTFTGLFPEAAWLPRERVNRNRMIEYLLFWGFRIRMLENPERNCRRFADAVLPVK